MVLRNHGNFNLLTRCNLHPKVFSFTPPQAHRCIRNFVLLFDNNAPDPSRLTASLQPEMHLIFQPPVSWVLCAVQLHLEGKVRSISALLKAEILQLNEICRENIEIL